jgi:hypothetical protein
MISQQGSPVVRIPALFLARARELYAIFRTNPQNADRLGLEGSFQNRSSHSALPPNWALSTRRPTQRSRQGQRASLQCSFLPLLAARNHRIPYHRPSAPAITAYMCPRSNPSRIAVTLATSQTRASPTATVRSVFENRASRSFTIDLINATEQPTASRAL